MAPYSQGPFRWPPILFKGHSDAPPIPLTRQLALPHGVPGNRYEAGHDGGCH